MMKRRKWKRWVLMGKLSLKELVDVARGEGMKCICGNKVSMCVHNQIGLYGTSQQMKQTEKRWNDNGHKVVNRQPGFAFSCNVNIPESEWVDTKEGGD